MWLTWQGVHVHLRDPVIAGSAARVPAKDDTPVAVSLVLNNLPHAVLHRAVAGPPELPAKREADSSAHRTILL